MPIPVEKQFVTVGVVCLLLGAVGGMSVKLGVSLNSIDNISSQIADLKSAIDKQDTTYRIAMEKYQDALGDLKGTVKFQGEEIDEMKSRLQQHIDRNSK